MLVDVFRPLLTCGHLGAITANRRVLDVSFVITSQGYAGQL
jgi:hypothetical protein